MTKRALLYELALNGMKGSRGQKIDNLRNQLRLVRQKTRGSGPVMTVYASANNGSKENDLVVAYDSNCTDGTACEYDSDATDCSEIEGFTVFRMRSRAV
jgi:hypothetical protein